MISDMFEIEFLGTNVDFISKGVPRVEKILLVAKLRSDHLYDWQ